jgi:hypothetical protein
MTREMVRTAGYALLGALAGLAAAAIAFEVHRAVRLDVGRDLANVATGFYPVEHASDESFAWSSSRADLSLPGFDRREDWACAVQFRGARPPSQPQPVVQVAADGEIVARGTATNQYQDLRFSLPVRPDSGLHLTFVVGPTFVPGPTDKRELGVQVRGLTCSPEGRLAMPPVRMLVASTLSAALFAAMLGALGLPGVAVVDGTLVVAAAQGFVLSIGVAPYSHYLSVVPWLAFWIAAVSVLSSGAITRWRRQPLDVLARSAIALSAGFLLLELVAILHPSKLIADALFHAHRLEWVLSGRYYFTQPLPSGVNFPYAIALYVIAAPGSLLTHDHVALLKVVVTVARALAGLALYPLVARVWSDRRTGLLAIALYHLAPLPFAVMEFANLTYAFGQSVAAGTLALVAMHPAGRRTWWWAIGIFVLASVAFLSHVGIFPLLLAIMCLTAALYRWAGARALKPAGTQIALAAVLAAILSVVVYYGHFPESYRTLQRLQPGASAIASAPAASSDATASSQGARSVAVRGRGERLVRAASMVASSFGWPILLLAVVGAVALWRARARDPIALLAAACGVVYVGFVGASAVMPIEPRLQRYSEEFISRVNFTVLPVAALLAAKGASWAWRREFAGRLAAAVLLLAALAGGTTAWLSWLR